MPRKKTWFGTRGHEVWIPTPSINPDYARTGYATRSDYLSGGAGVRESKNAHNSYVLSWSQAKTREAVRLITDFADGVFDTQNGINLIYWHDPMAMDQNCLAQAWATPALAAEDAPPIITDGNGYGRPKAVPTPVNNLRYPARSAQYSQLPTSISLEQYIPIPPGHSVWVGVHGDSAAAGRIVVQRVNGFTEIGSPVAPALLGVTSERVNTEFSSADSSGIIIRVAPTATPQVFTLHALVAQVHETGHTPPTGPFISGQGNSGCQFVGKPTTTPYSARMDRVGATARLEETGMYL